MATLGLDTSGYEKNLQNAQNDTKRMVSQLSSEYSKTAKRVEELTRKYNESAEKTGKNSKETRELKTQLSAAQAQLKTTASSLKTAESAMSGLASHTKSASAEQNGFTSSLAGSIAKAQAFTSVILSLGSKLTGAAKSVATVGIDYNAQIETYRTGLTNMLGDANAANQALENMKQDAARTPFDTESIVKANQYLIGAGENVDYTRKTILALGDAISATGGGSDELNRMAQNLQQIANVGKASSVDIKQFAFAGINIYQVLADYTGKSVQDVQKMTVTYDVLTKALQAAAEEGGRYYNSMDTQSQTLTGRLSTLKDNATQLAGALTEKLSSAYGTVVSKANDLAVAMKDGWETDGLDGMLQAVRETTPELSGLANVIQFCSNNSDTLITLLGMAAGAMLTYNAAATTAKTTQAALNAVMNANPIGILITLLGALAGAFVTAYASSDSFRANVNNAFESVASTAKSTMSAAITWLDKLSYKLNKALGKNGYTDYSSYEDWKADRERRMGDLHEGPHSGERRRNRQQGDHAGRGQPVRHPPRRL